MSHVISDNDIEHFIYRLYFTDDIIVVANRTSKDLNNAEVKIIKVKENDARKPWDIA